MHMTVIRQRSKTMMGIKCAWVVLRICQLVMLSISFLPLTLSWASDIHFNLHKSKGQLPSILYIPPQYICLHFFTGGDRGCWADGLGLRSQFRLSPLNWTFLEKSQLCGTEPSGQGPMKSVVREAHCVHATFAKVESTEKFMKKQNTLLPLFTVNNNKSILSRNITIFTVAVLT